MAQYLMSVLDDGHEGRREDDETAGLASAEEGAAIDAFNEQLEADGHWVFAGGLGSPVPATVVDARDGEPLFTDGPYLESKEYMGGLWIINAPDLDVALRLAAQGSKACNRRIEVRPFLGE